MIYGQDWASYQSETPSVQGIDFAIIKATEGTGYVNPKMTKQAATARTAGLVVGFYHFLHPGNIAGQAQYFVSKAASLPGDILACDWESSSAGSATCAEKDEFMREVKRLRPGHRVILYCNTYFWLHRDTSSYAGDGLWIADPNHPVGHPAIQSPWVIHQYSSAGGLDRNAAQFSSRAAMRAWASEEDEMALTDAQAAQLKALYEERRIAPWQYKNTKIDGRDMHQVLRDTDAGVKALAKKVAALETTGLTDEQISAIAVKVADVLAARLDS